MMINEIRMCKSLWLLPLAIKLQLIIMGVVTEPAGIFAFRSNGKPWLEQISVHNLRTSHSWETGLSHLAFEQNDDSEFNQMVVHKVPFIVMPQCNLFVWCVISLLLHTRIWACLSTAMAWQCICRDSVITSYHHCKLGRVNPFSVTRLSYYSAEVNSDDPASSISLSGLLEVPCPILKDWVVPIQDSVLVWPIPYG